MFNKIFRIREIGGYFIPQYRFSFFKWQYFRNYGPDNTYEIVDFQTLEESEKFLSCQTETIHIPKNQKNSNFSLFSSGNITQQNIK